MNTYIFNWNVVVHVCPEYEQYLNKNFLDTGNTAPAWTPRLPHVRTSGDEEEDKVISEMCDGSVDVRGQLSQAIQEIRQEMGNREEETTPKVGYTLKDQYKNPPLAENYNPLQLLPPKRFLDVGSKLMYPGDMGYSVEYHIFHNKYNDLTNDLVKIKLSIDGDKIRLISARYWFDQHRNITSDRRGAFKCLVYNKKTRNLYFMKRQENKNLKTGSVRYSNVVRGILWSTDSLDIAFGCFSERSVENFMKLLEREIRKDLPDVFIPDYRPSYHPNPHYAFAFSNHTQAYSALKTIAIVIQHKVGCRLDWLETEFIKNLKNLIYIHDFEGRLTNTKRDEEWEDLQRRVTNQLKYRVRKVIPTIRKYRSPKKLMKALCGKYYYNLLLKLAFINVLIDENDWINMMKLRNEGEFPKPLYHWLNELLKNERGKSESQAVSLILNVIHRFGDKWTLTRESCFIDSWIKLNKRFVSQGDALVGWDTWKDTCRMADELRIRLRPNKFKNRRAVRGVHDTLAAIQRRDLTEKTKYENTVFEEFAIPDREYEGFQFVQLKTAKELVHEGTTMHHCVGGYSGYCASGRSIIFSMRKGERSYVTIELRGNTYEIKQKYTIHDNIVTSEKALDIIDEWHKDVLEMHKKDKTSYYELIHQKKEAERKARLEHIEEEFCRAVMDDTVNESPVDEDEVDFVDLLEEAAHGEA